MKNWKGILSVLLSATLLGGMAPSAAPVQPASGETVYALTVNDRTHPLGVDSTPVFGWKLSLTGFDRAQSAYRIVVASTPDDAAAQRGTVWDSGKQNGDNNYDIAYAGGPLASQTAYYWTVEAWDETGASVGVSAPACFETGLLDQDAWTGKFIQVSKAAETNLTFDDANWIWLRSGAAFDGAPAGDMYFRKGFAASDALEKAELIFTADDQSTLYLNGAAVGNSDAWGTAVGLDVTDKLHTGDNLLALKATNTTVGYAGVLCKLKLTYTNGGTEVLCSDRSWKVSKSASGNWFAADFDDSGWASPDQAERFGASPWGTGVTVGAPGYRTAPIFRKTFSVSKPLARARAYVCGLGLYDLDVNGQDADDSVLNPAHTDYNDTLLYNVYDLTDKLTQGENAVGVMVGHGFFNSIMDGWNWSQADWIDEPMLRMEILLDYEDGGSEKIVTDESWKTSLDGPVTADDIYYGETYDARRTLDGYSTAAFADDGWKNAALATAPRGRMTYEDMEPMRRVAAYETTVRKSGDSYIVEAPAVMTGWLKVQFHEARDAQITIRYGEKLDRNDKLVLKTESKGPTQSDSYICAGENDVYEPRFSYKGFQYVQIDGLQNGITAEDVTAYQVNNDLQTIGTVETADPLINALHAMSVRTMLNNFQGKPTDTPYLEKNGWLGDANVALEMFNFNFGIQSFMRKFIGDMNDAQQSDGDLPSLVPIYNWGVNNAPVWNTIFVNAARELQNSFGNKTLVERQYSRMRAFVQKEMRESKARGWGWYDDQYADWVSPMGGGSAMQYDERSPEGAAICGTAYIYKALDSMAAFADQLGKPEDAQEYRDAMQNIYTAFNRKYYKAAKGVYETGYWDRSHVHRRTTYRQTSNIVALAFGLVPEEHKQTVLNNLLKDIKSKNYHLDTGMVGTKYILPVLAENGYADVAYRILTQTTYPSWGYWVEKGATTAHEMWEDTSRSLDHYFLSTYEDYLYKGLGGICEIADGYKTVTIRPQMAGDLTHAAVSVETVRGKLQSDWTRGENDRTVYKLEIPVGTTATVILPTAAATVNGAPAAQADGVRAAESSGENELTLTVGSGSYTLEFDAALEPKNIDAHGITLTPETLTLTEGEQSTLTATVTPESAVNKEVAWSSDATAVATVDATGVVRAVKAGTAVVTATAKDGGFTASCTVTVNAKPAVEQPSEQKPSGTVAVTGVSLNRKKQTVTRGKTITLTATVTPAGATDKTVRWQTSNKKVATVSGGKVKAVGAGTARITATAGGKTAVFTLTVRPKKVKKLTVKAKGRRVTFTVKPAAKTDRIEIRYKTKAAKKFKTLDLGKKKKAAKTLKKGKYTVYAVAYVKAGGKKIRSAKSKTKRVTIG